MHKMIFADGYELPCTGVEEGPQFYDGAHRRVLRIVAQTKAASLHKLQEVVAKAGNLAQLRHLNAENGAEDVFAHYEILIELALRPHEVGQDEDGAPQYELRIELRLGRLTPLEIKLAKLGV